MTEHDSNCIREFSAYCPESVGSERSTRRAFEICELNYHYGSRRGTHSVTCALVRLPVHNVPFSQLRAQHGQWYPKPFTSDIANKQDESHSNEKYMCYAFEAAAASVGC